MVTIDNKEFEFATRDKSPSSDNYILSKSGIYYCSDEAVYILDDFVDKIIESIEVICIINRNNIILAFANNKNINANCIKMDINKDNIASIIKNIYIYLVNNSTNNTLYILNQNTLMSNMFIKHLKDNSIKYKVINDDIIKDTLRYTIKSYSIKQKIIRIIVSSFLILSSISVSIYINNYIDNYFRNYNSIINKNKNKARDLKNDIYIKKNKIKILKKELNTKIELKKIFVDKNINLLNKDFYIKDFRIKVKDEK